MNYDEQDVPLLPGPTDRQQKQPQKRSKLLTVCPFILGKFNLRAISAGLGLAGTADSAVVYPLAAAAPLSVRASSKTCVDLMHSVCDAMQQQYCLL